MSTAITKPIESICRGVSELVAALGAIAFLATPAWSHDVQPHPHAEDSKAADEYKHP